MIIHKIGNLWNFNSFSDCKIVRIYVFRNGTISEIFEIVKFGKFLEFSGLKVFGNSKIGNF